MARPRDPGHERVRAFFALELGRAHPAAVACLEQARANDGEHSMRWVSPESLHLTLRFLGEVPAASVDAITGAVATAVAGIRPFALALGAPRAFPTPRRARVLVLEVAKSEALARLAAAVERGVVAAGLAPETRRFRPHVTLARLRRGKDFPAVTATDTPAAETFDVAEVVLFQSELRSSGARYTALARLPLAPV